MQVIDGNKLMSIVLKVNTAEVDIILTRSVFELKTDFKILQVVPTQPQSTSNNQILKKVAIDITFSLVLVLRIWCYMNQDNVVSS